MLCLLYGRCLKSYNILTVEESVPKSILYFAGILFSQLKQLPMIKLEIKNYIDVIEA